MYKLQIEPVRSPASFEAAKTSLYGHARHHQLVVEPLDVFNGQHRFRLRNPRTDAVESIATISEMV